MFLFFFSDGHLCFFLILFVILLAGGVSSVHVRMCACVPPLFFIPPAGFSLIFYSTRGALLVAISADLPCLQNPSPGGVVPLIALPSARPTQLTLLLLLLEKSLPGGGMQLPSPLANPPPALRRPLPSRVFTRIRMLNCVRPLRLLHLTRQRLRLGSWLQSLLIVWLPNKTLHLLAPHLAMALLWKIHCRLRWGKGWDYCLLHSPPCGMPGGVVAVVPYILLVMVVN